MVNVSIVIPTYNRPKFLQRILVYYNKYGGDFKIIVADSSSDKNKKLNKKIISSFSNLEILYLGNYPDKINHFVKYANAINYVRSKYCLLCADDDFIVPLAIKECAIFLEKNPDYSVVRGLYCSHWLIKRKGRIEFGWAPGCYRGESVTFDSPSERLKVHLSNYHTSTFYGVHRTNLLRFIFREVIKTTSHGRLSEILLTGLTLISGKMKISLIFYGSREHENSSVEKTLKTLPYVHTPWSFFLNSDNYQTEYRRAVDCLARNLQKQTNLATDLPRKAAKEALNGYFNSLRLAGGPLQKIRGRLLGAISKTLNKLHLRNLMLMYRQILARRRINNIRTNIRLRGLKREYIGLLEKNDSKFHQNLRRIKKAVIDSKVYVIK